MLIYGRNEYNLTPDGSMMFNSFEDHQFIRWRIEQYDCNGLLVFSYDLDLNGNEVLIIIDPNAIGDSIAWFQSVVDFQKKWSLSLHLIMNEQVAELFKDNYKSIFFHSNDDSIKRNVKFIYRLGTVFGSNNESYVFRNFFDPYVMLSKTGCMTLGVEFTRERPKPKFSSERLIKEKYVCISSFSSKKEKNWNNIDGWNEVCEWLTERGYRVIDIDRNEIVQYDDEKEYIPDCAENWTGALPLSQRLQLIANSDLYIGLASGLTWLAWLVNVPKIVILGGTLDHTEICDDACSFIYDRQKCRGCLTHHPSDALRLGCKYKGRARAYECTKSITFEMVIHQIKKKLHLD